MTIKPSGRPPIHGHKPGGKPSPTFISWEHMRQRCLAPGSRSYSDYGGRGITICERWSGPDGFPNFLADMGERPNGKTLDRIDSNGNYEPGNCRWATRVQQSRNRRLGRTQQLVLQLIASGGPKDAATLAYDWPTLTKGATRETLRSLYRRGFIDVHGFNGRRRTYDLTAKGRDFEQGGGYWPDLDDTDVCPRCEGTGVEGLAG